MIGCWLSSIPRSAVQVSLLNFPSHEQCIHHWQCKTRGGKNLVIGDVTDIRRVFCCAIMLLNQFMTTNGQTTFQEEFRNSCEELNFTNEEQTVLKDTPPETVARKTVQITEKFVLSPEIQRRMRPTLFAFSPILESNKPQRWRRLISRATRRRCRSAHAISSSR